MADEQFYAQAFDEFERTPDKGILAKALVRANGDQAKLKSEYIKIRVAALKSIHEKSHFSVLLDQVAQRPGDFSKEKSRSLAVILFYVFLVITLVLGAFALSN